LKNCFVFPGQGAQYPGMGKDLYENSAEVRALFDRVSALLGRDMKALLFNSTEEELKKTENTQVAVTLMNLAAAAYLKEKGLEPDMVAGFSLGEYAALNVAGVLSEKDLFTLVEVRGRLMAEATEALDKSQGEPGMAAVIGLQAEALDAALAEAGIADVFAANYNAPTQTVISGTAQGLAAATEVLKAAGARRIIPLKVSSPNHTPLLASAAGALKEVTASMAFQDPRVLLFSNVTAAAVSTGEQSRELSLRHMVSPVLWTREEAAILEAGAQRIIEVGPGQVLTGLWGSIGSEVPCLPAGKVEQADALFRE